MKPKIIAVASTKGGCGKSTLALQLAIARAKQGFDTWVVDGDRQQTSTMALSLRASQKVKPGIACASYPDGTLLQSQVLLQCEKWDSIIIDVGGVDSTSLRAALTICNVLLIPFQPRSFDCWALSQIAELIKDVKKVRRRPFRVYAVLNAADPTDTIDNMESIAAAQEFGDLEILKTKVCRRKAFANASGFGLGVSELKVKDKKAIAEIDELTNEVFKDIGI